MKKADVESRLFQCGQAVVILGKRTDSLGELFEKVIKLLEDETDTIRILKNLLKEQNAALRALAEKHIALEERVKKCEYFCGVDVKVIK